MKKNVTTGTGEIPPINIRPLLLTGFLCSYCAFYIIDYQPTLRSSRFLGAMPV
jgi:hypothetical protein